MGWQRVVGVLSLVVLDHKNRLPNSEGQASGISELAFWPSPQDYNEALQDLQQNLADESLAVGEPELDAFGLPRPISGMFACVYKIRCHNNDWAVRCFLRSKSAQMKHYLHIADTLQRIALPCMVPFEFQQNGIRINGKSHPILKMQWCSGEALDRWLAQNLCNKQILQTFLDQFCNLLNDFQYAGIAHGDLQHGNILIDRGKIKLVDYDGMYVHEFAGLTASELGHRNYQHPRRTEKHFGPYLDNFSAWLIYLSVFILGSDPQLWQEFDGGDECLLFREQDLLDPRGSRLFQALNEHPIPEIRQCSHLLKYILQLRPETIPPLHNSVGLSRPRFASGKVVQMRNKTNAGKSRQDHKINVRKQATVKLQKVTTETKLNIACLSLFIVMNTVPLEAIETFMNRIVDTVSPQSHHSFACRHVQDNKTGESTQFFGTHW